MAENLNESDFIYLLSLDDEGYVPLNEKKLASSLSEIKSISKEIIEESLTTTLSTIINALNSTQKKVGSVTTNG